MPSYSLVTVSRGTVALEKGSSVVSFHSHPHLFQLAGPPSHTHFSAPQGGEGEACASDKKKTSEKKQRNRFLSFCAGEPARTSVCGVGDLSLSCRGGVGDPFLHGHRGGVRRNTALGNLPVTTVAALRPDTVLGRKRVADWSRT